MLKQFSQALAVMIIAGDKKQAVVSDRNNEAKEGETLHMAFTGNTSKSLAFAHAALDTVEDIEIVPEEQIVRVKDRKGAWVKLDAERFAVNEGLRNAAELFAQYEKPFKGKVVYWNAIKR